MKWSEIHTGDMVVVNDVRDMFKPFEHDVYFVIGVSSENVGIPCFGDITMLRTNVTQAIVFKHRNAECEVSEVFSVFRAGRRLTHTKEVQ